MQDEKAIYERALIRERAARKSAEKILEQKATELYELNRELNAKNLILEENFATKEKELQALFKNLVEGYVITDLDGFILSLNDSARSILELKPSGTFNLHSLIAEDEMENLRLGLATLSHKESLSDFQLRITTLSGAKKIIMVNASAIKDTAGKVVALQALIRDVTEVRKLEKDREALLTRLKLQNQELEEFAHVISHDLKSPLRNLYTLSTWIQESIATESANSHVSNNFSLIFATLERMDNMISEILQFSKSDKDAMHFEEVDVNLLLTNLKQQYKTRKKLQLDIASGIPKVYGVRVKLLQVFQNLIDNAIKFNDKGQKIVRITYEDISNDKIRVSIRDNGLGIEERHYTKVFKLFETSDLDRTSSGVGLAIVKKILDAHQSEITIESEVGEFTQFNFNLKKYI